MTTAVQQLTEDLVSLNVPSGPPLTPLLMHLAQEIDAPSTSAAGITATGSTQATAYQLTAAINTVGTAAALTGVNMPAASPGAVCYINNDAANAIQIYAAQGMSDTINGAPGSIGVSVDNSARVIANSTTAGVWDLSVSGSRKSRRIANTASAAATLTATNILRAEGLNVIDMTGSLSGGAALTLPTGTDAAAITPWGALNVGNVLRIINDSAGAFAWTLTANTNFSVSGTVTIAQATWREFSINQAGGAYGTFSATDIGGGSIV